MERIKNNSESSTSPSGIAALRADDRGTAVLEFALVAPLLLLILFGIVGYGGYFWRAHSLQQVANDAARASLAGLTASERRLIATDTVNREIGALSGLRAEQAQVRVDESGETITVELAYDAIGDSFMRLGLVPLPDRTIRRKSAVRLGGL